MYLACYGLHSYLSTIQLLLPLCMAHWQHAVLSGLEVHALYHVMPYHDIQPCWCLTTSEPHLVPTQNFVMLWQFWYVNCQYQERCQKKCGIIWRRSGLHLGNYLTVLLNKHQSH